ncbi:MAG: hypothetical protein JJE25_01785 [Bacteroidia bacterium]|nr:hypothetical protein [Bacteroidia bacterium]
MMKATTALILFLGLISMRSQSQSVLDLGKVQHKVFIAGKSEGEITKEELLNPKGIETPDTSHFVSGFAMNISEANSDSLGRRSMMVYGYSVKEGNQFTEEIRKVIEKLPAGSTISIGDIYCYQRYKGKHYVSTLYFTIK